MYFPFCGLLLWQDFPSRQEVTRRTKWWIFLFVCEVCALCLGGALFRVTEPWTVLKSSACNPVWVIMAKNSKSLGIPVGHMVRCSLLFRFSFVFFKNVCFKQKRVGELDYSATITNVLAVPVVPVVVKHPWVRSRNGSIHIYQSVMCGLN